MATYYVDPVSGSDGNAGTSFALAWATTQKAADTAVGGDEVRLCATGTETITSGIDFDTNAGSASARIRFVAYDATGSAPLDGTGQYTIDASGIAGTDDGISIAIANIYIEFYDIRVTNSPRYGLISGTDSYFLLFVRCRFDNSASMGVRIQSTAVGARPKFLWCEADHNGSDGFGNNGSGRLLGTFLGCRAHNNTGDGFNIGGQLANLLFCEAFANSGDGIELNGAANIMVKNCTVYNNTGSGVNLNGANECVVANNSISSNGSYGINRGSTYPAFIGYNHYNGNTSGEWSTGSSTEDGKQTGDPLFADTTPGSEDFTPDDGSPLDGTGFNGSDIGAVGTADPVGGGGGTRAWAS